MWSKEGKSVCVFAEIAINGYNKNIIFFMSVGLVGWVDLPAVKMPMISERSNVFNTVYIPVVLQ